MFGKFVLSALAGSVCAIQAEGGYHPGYGAPQMGYGMPQMGYGAPQMGYGAPQMGYGAPQMGYGMPQQMPYGRPPMPYGGQPQMPYGAPQQPYGAPAAPQQPYAAPQQPYQAPNPPKMVPYEVPQAETKYASCSLADPAGNSGVAGTLLISQTKGEKALIQGTVSGLATGHAGLSVHKFGDVAGTCNSTGKQLAELTELHTDETGIANHFVSEQYGAMLWGDMSIIGRAMVVTSDLYDSDGYSDRPAPKVACCVVGIDQKPEGADNDSSVAVTSKWTTAKSLDVTMSAKVRAMKTEVEPMLRMRLSGWKPVDMQTATTAGWKHKINVETNQGKLQIEVMDKPGHGKSGLVITKLEWA